jgi:hypothetical protein
MGWTFETKAKSAQHYIDQFTKPYESDRDSWHISTAILKHFYDAISSDKGVLYVVAETTKSKPHTKTTVTRFINVYLLEFSPTDGCWGYKAMDCCMGPVADTCPLEFLDLCPPHDGHEWCHNFHNRCRAMQADCMAAKGA